MKIQMQKTLFLFLSILSCIWLKAQNYHALNGSSYSGVTGMYNNPASTVNNVNPWDISLLSIQASNSNTLLTAANFSIRNDVNSAIYLTNGLQPRYLHNNMDLNLFNFRFNAGKNRAFSFALRGRSYNDISISAFKYQDTINSVNSFLQLNKDIGYFNGYGTSNSWLEGDLNYAQLFSENTTSRLSGGITIGIMRGISGAHGNINGIRYLDQSVNNVPNYILTNADFTAEYSKNYDLLDGHSSNISNVKTFLKNTLTALNFSFGIEYLIRALPPLERDPISVTNYDWKFGISLMDLGANRYVPSSGSFTASSPVTNTSSAVLENKLQHITVLRQLRDSITPNFNTIKDINSIFTIANPTRLLLSADRNLGNFFYINGQLNINLFSTTDQVKLKTRELNFLTVTPRWETNSWGVYLPVQLNTQGQLWIGGALKMGPVLLGFHNLDIYQIFKKQNQRLNGGFYMIINIHPFNNTPKTADCPPV